MWEYKFHKMRSAIDDEIIRVLNEMAADGWELVAYDFARNEGLFKRMNGGVRV